MVNIIDNAPCKGNSLIIRLLPLQGVWFVCGLLTQGAALGYVVLPLRGVSLASFALPPSIDPLQNNKLRLNVCSYRLNLEKKE